MSTEVIKQNNSKADVAAKIQPPKRKRSWSLERRRSAAGYLFISPWILGFIAFLGYPLIMSLIYSFNKVTIEGGVVMKPQGFNNYIQLFTQDKDFVPKFLETILRSVLWTPFIVVFALFIAMLLNRKIRFRGTFRLIYFLPVLLGTGFVFQSLSSVTGLIATPQSLTRSLSYMIGDPKVTQFILDLIRQILQVFWKTGVQIVIFLAGLQSISESLYEAAKVDSANGWDMMFKITIPMLSPVILLNTVYTVIDSFRDQTNPLVEYIVKMVFSYGNFGVGTAMGWLYFIFALILIGLVFVIMRRSVYYEK